MNRIDLLLKLVAEISVGFQLMQSNSSEDVKISIALTLTDKRLDHNKFVFYYGG